jgi:ankyrin repeat protein
LSAEETVQLLEKAMRDQKALEVLLDGIKESDVQAVKAALEAAPHLLSERIKHYETGDVPLHVACAVGSTTIIKILMEAGADIHQRDGQGRTALKVICCVFLVISKRSGAHC